MTDRPGDTIGEGERQRKPGESPLEHAKRMHHPLISIDELIGLERYRARTASSTREGENT